MKMRELLELVTVEKVTTDRERSFIRLYIESERLIQKRNIYILEASIKKSAVFRIPDGGQNTGKIPSFRPV